MSPQPPTRPHNPFALRTDPQAPAVTALRSRILARFTELEAECATLTAQLAALACQEHDQHDPSLLGELPLLPPGVLAEAPPRLLTQLYQTLDLQLLCNRREDQVTIRAVLTDTTPGQITALLAPSAMMGTAPAPTRPPLVRQSVRFLSNALG